MNFEYIYIIIVLYKTSLENSKTIQTIKKNIGCKINIMVYDNSPERQYYEDIFYFDNLKITYYHDSSNPGLSYAYNLALKNASKLNLEWIMLFDQDTNLNYDYFLEIKKLEINKIKTNIVAIIPKVISNKDNKMISPTRMNLGGFSKPISLNPGIIKESISGINSGTILCVTFMNSINGFNLNYSLDMLDHWYFRKIKQMGKNVYLLNSAIKQDLSVFGNFEENISLKRYKQLINAESLYLSEENLISNLLFKVRLIIRIIKQLNYKDKKYLSATYKELIKLRFKNA